MIPSLTQLPVTRTGFGISTEAREQIFEGGARDIAPMIMKNLYAGDGEDGKKMACNAAINWIRLNNMMTGYQNEDVMWKALVENVFPDSAPVTNTSGYKIGDLLYVKHGGRQVTYRDFFYELCNRHEKYRTRKAAFDKIQPEYVEAETKMSQALRHYFELLPHTVENTRLVNGIEYELKNPLQRKFALPQMVHEYLALDRSAQGFGELRSRMTLFRQARYNMSIARMSLNEVADNLGEARALLTQWWVLPEALKVKRQKHYDDFDSPSNPAEDPPDQETFNRTGWL